MKTVKISLVATLASMLAWRIHLPQRIWPMHPMLAITLLALALCILLQFAWIEPDQANETRMPSREQAASPEAVTKK
jgi:hypothetical protein